MIKFIKRKIFEKYLPFYFERSFFQFKFRELLIKTIKVKQIKAGSETVISRDINLERYLKDIRKTKTLTYAEERIVILEAQQGNQKQFEKLISANLRFVVSCAKEYQYPGVDIIDLISAGNIGLMEAVKKFDLTKDIKFISYAVWWIKNAIIEHLKENVKIIRLPYNQLQSIKVYQSAKEKLEQKHEMNLGTDQVGELSGIDVNYIRQSLSMNERAASLSDPIGSDEDGGGILEDQIGDASANFFDEYEKDFKKNIITVALNRLNPTQRQIISLSYGVEGGVCHSNEDIAEQLSLTAERIRQIKNQALEKLKKVKQLQACF